jgi:hypothetical protein
LAARRVVLEHSDLHLRPNAPTPNLTHDQEERMLVIFDMLIALFERAYLVAYSPKMLPVEARRSREDFAHGAGGRIRSAAVAARDSAHPKTRAAPVSIWASPDG